MRKFLPIITGLVLSGLLSCGGDYTSIRSDEPAITETVTLVDSAVVSTSLDGEDKIEATLRCRINSITAERCEFRSVTVSYPGMNLSFTVPLDVSLSSGESRTVSIKVGDGAIKSLEPFAYLRDVNPSTSSGGWTIRNEVIADFKAAMIATGYEVCDSQGQCRPGENFAGTVESYTPGTLSLWSTAGKLLEETSFGLLTGQGTGYVSPAGDQYSVVFTVTGGVPNGAPINAAYLLPLRTFYARGAARLTYGDLVLTLDGDVFKDSYGNVYGTYSPTTGTIQWTRPIGSRQGVMVASYEGEPYVAIGGETVGTGDGVHDTYSLRTKYPHVISSTLKVFTSHGPGQILYLDPEAGSMVVKFTSPVPAGEEIKASYVVSMATVPVELSFETKTGQKKFSITYTVKRQ